MKFLLFPTKNSQLALLSFGCSLIFHIFLISMGYVLSSRRLTDRFAEKQLPSVMQAREVNTVRFLFYPRKTPRALRERNQYGHSPMYATTHATVVKQELLTAPPLAKVVQQKTAVHSEEDHLIVSAMEHFFVGLRSAIEREIIYPAIARSKRQCGLVRIGFTLQKNGVISNVHLVEGSSSRRLDEAALESMKRIASLKVLHQDWMQGDLKMVIPIQFRLKHQ